MVLILGFVALSAVVYLPFMLIDFILGGGTR